ncbi:autonomous glycyl radical cofactor GrcA [Clostridium sp. AF19-22AC]|jgi:pyruvate-formate lyase|uniref:Formate C-acetyltransferase n=1 Tax=Faecalicatena orotica TaxID=1544 RepID=A0A2Y9BKT5_9FIRM|nr:MULTISPECIES: glycine radical domain-containing protein [Clostridia]PWJ22559.1 formate C-acetyltransferase [Faecalicatena orotica]RHR26220.1 autonomous glycyl radical cofactor GrcA [Clostridium sp. AF19-22AC]SSA58228.1 formate C-acetyltransferase [Faecalicatena orotica]
MERVMRNDGLKRFVSLIDEYFASGGAQMQFNIVSRETLLAAQAHPEEYSNLLVRVAGYSAYFTQLSKDVQQDIIERTEEKL